MNFKSNLQLIITKTQYSNIGVLLRIVNRRKYKIHIQ